MSNPHVSIGPFRRLPQARRCRDIPAMLLLSLLAAAVSAAAPPPDSLARSIAVAPQESLRVTMMGPELGAPVVIIPGLISPAYAFRNILPPLADAGVRAVVIEPLGVGHSSHPGGDADYSHTAQAARIAAVMDTLGIRSAVVMGHTVGTAMALRLAVARPDLVSRLLLLEGGALENAAVPGVKTALKFSFLVRIFGGRGRVKKEIKKGLIGNSVDSTWVTDELIERYTEGSAGDMGGVLRALKGMQKAVERDSLSPQLSSLQPPVRLLLGGGPYLNGGTGLSEGRIRSLQRRVPVFSMDSIPGVGMHLHEERPDLIVAEILREVEAARQ